jgi:pleiotropic regulator 1
MHLPSALCTHPFQFTFASGGADNVKKFSFTDPYYLGNLDSAESHIRTLALNPEIETPSTSSASSSAVPTGRAGGVLVGGCATGHLAFWDWRTGYMFQKLFLPLHPGSLESEVSASPSPSPITLSLSSSPALALSAHSLRSSA